MSSVEEERGGRGGSSDTNAAGVPLDFTNAKSFLEKNEQGIEGVLWRGKHLVVQIRSDGNCFFTSSVTGVLLWAVSQKGADAIEGVVGRFSDAIGSSGRVAYSDAYSALPEECKVRFPKKCLDTPGIMIIEFVTVSTVLDHVASCVNGLFLTIFRFALTTWLRQAFIFQLLGGARSRDAATQRNQRGLLRKCV